METSLYYLKSLQVVVSVADPDPQAVLTETGWIFLMARSMLMPFASAYACARSAVSFSAMTR